MISSQRVPASLGRIFDTALAMLAVLFLSLFLAYFSFFLIENFNLYGLIRFTDDEKFDRELFSRIFIFWILFPLIAPLLINQRAKSYFIPQRLHQIIFVLFCLGALTAVLDRWHWIPSEYNWIRYWTAGVLLAAGGIGIWCGFLRAYPILDRLCGVAFGLLLIAAAGDELFQFHEDSGDSMNAMISTGGAIDGQDLSTLAVAVVAFSGFVGCLLLVRIMPWTRHYFRDPKYRRALFLLFSGVSFFLMAMLLDSFDWYLELLIDPIRVAYMGWSGLDQIPHWFAKENVAQAANGLEELLEYLAAIMFLMAVATVFSIKALGGTLTNAVNGQNSDGPEYPIEQGPAAGRLNANEA